MWYDSKDPVPKLSENGQRIKQLVDGGKKLADVVREHPELIDFLDEYTAYEAHRARVDGRQETMTDVTHPIAEQVQKLASQKR